MTRRILVGLVRGRHPLPVEEYIFNDKIDNVFNFKKFEDICEDFILRKIPMSVKSSLVGRTHVTYSSGDAELVVYLTGLTACSTALVYVCSKYNVTLTLMHYNNTTGGYKPQKFTWVE